MRLQLTTEKVSGSFISGAQWAGDELFIASDDKRISKLSATEAELGGDGAQTVRRVAPLPRCCMQTPRVLCAAARQFVPAPLCPRRRRPPRARHA